MSEPTNAELLVAIQAQRQEFKEHTGEDHTFQDETRLMQAHQASSSAETEGKLAQLELKIDGLATKEDITELKQFLKSVKIGEGIVRFTFDNSAKIGSLALFILGIFIFFKVGIAGLIAFFVHRP